MYLHPDHLKLFEYCRHNSRGMLSRKDLKFIDDINKRRKVFESRNHHLSPGQAKWANDIIRKLEQQTNGAYDRWQLTNAENYTNL
jgi:hypothetical protein